LVLDTSADQFEIKNTLENRWHPHTYHYIGITLVPMEVVHNNPDTFWMYTKQPIIDAHLSEDDEYTDILKEIIAFGPQGKPSKESIERRDLLVLVYPEIVHSIRDYFRETYRDTAFSSLNIIITIGGSTSTGVAIDGSDIDLYFLVDDSGLPEAVKLTDEDKRNVVIKTRGVLNKMAVEYGSTGIKQQHPTEIYGEKVWFLRDVLEDLESDVFDRPIANAFLVSYGPVESIRRKLLNVIIHSGRYKKWRAIRETWSSFVNDKHLKRLDSQKGLSLKLPDLTTMLAIYDISIPDGMTKPPRDIKRSL